ncbi:protein kinase subdomain-containing protein [Colletotrichum sojae]|uniref:Protein kinase subdomain-containing protein n=1 Tax=Colletotrichum sojae TaxID=2175907 RepID=A0A8H6MT70_9PEZI|nr:protein kinase subdomain-containing protein [Colletotrichum sojae]
MQLAGKLDEAEGLEARVLELCTENPKVGPGDRSIMSAISNIATLRSAKGEHQSADEMWRHVLEVDEKFRGKEHPNTLQSKRNVAIGCVKLDRLEEAERPLREVLEAERSLREVLEASERVLWRTHLDTLVTIDCLASLLYQKDEHKEALELQEECLAGRTRGLGEDHQLTLKTKRDLEKMKYGENMVMEEQVQWQGEAAPTAGDSNFAMQGMNDRYLY